MYMETGIKAWIANQDPHVHTKVDLPGWVLLGHQTPEIPAISRARG